MKTNGKMAAAPLADPRAEAAAQAGYNTALAAARAADDRELAAALADWDQALAAARAACHQAKAAPRATDAPAAAARRKVVLPIVDQPKQDLANLAKARRGLDLDTPDAFGDPVERARRAEFYARQVAETGRIRTWMPRPAWDGRSGEPRRGRFQFGDALGRHLAACAG